MLAEHLFTPNNSS